MWFTDEKGNKVNTENNKPGISSSQLHDKGSDVIAESIHNKKKEEEEGIGDFSAKERKEIEEELGDKIESCDDEYKGQRVELENGEEWIIFKNYDDAEEAALEYEKDMLETDPGVWEGADWINDFIKISDTDRRIIASETEMPDMDDEEIREKAKEYGIKSTGDIDKVRENVEYEYSKEIEERLKDPIQYFVHDEGIYSKEDLAKANFVSIDFEAAARYIVDSDGVGSILSSYDGDEKELKNGMYAYRRN